MIPRPQRTVNIQSTSRLNVLEKEPMVEEEKYFAEDLLAIEGPALQTTEAESLGWPAEQSKKQQEVL